MTSTGPMMYVGNANGQPKTWPNGRFVAFTTDWNVP
jgi:hypothetical protein